DSWLEGVVEGYQRVVQAVVTTDEGAHVDLVPGQGAQCRREWAAPRSLYTDFVDDDGCKVDFTGCRYGAFQDQCASGSDQAQGQFQPLFRAGAFNYYVYFSPSMLNDLIHVFA